ncbi:MAG: hypothetical protein M3R70_05605 [Actinomycetota bacterium]|nr:hypothetical protein [Actinomycetota bacterium]
MYAALYADRLEQLVSVAGLGGLLLLTLGLVAREPFSATLGLAGVGAAYGLAAWTRGADVPLEAPVVAAALLTSAELAFWSLERLVAQEESAVAWRRAALVLGVAVASVFVGSMLLLPAAVPLELGLAGDVLGVVAAVAVVALVVGRSSSPLQRD